MFKKKRDKAIREDKRTFSLCKAKTEANLLKKNATQTGDVSDKNKSRYRAPSLSSEAMSQQ